MSLQLNGRERNLLILGGAALILFLGWTFILRPGLDEMERLDQSIAKHTQDLEELRQTAGELIGLRTKLLGLSSRISVREKGFSLAGRLEERIDQAGLKKHLDSLQPLPSQKTQDNLTLDAVDLKLKEFPLEAMVKLLHGLEHSDKPLGVTRFIMVRGRKGLEASLRVETLIKN